MQHPNARLTPRGRRELVRLVERGATLRSRQRRATSRCRLRIAGSCAGGTATRADRASLGCLARPLEPAASQPASARRRARARGRRGAPADRLGAAAGRRRARRAAPDGLEGPAPPRLLAPAAAGARGGQPVRVAVSGRSAAHGRLALRALRSARPRAHRRPLATHATGCGPRHASATTTPTRSSTTTPAWPTSSCTTTSAPRPSPASSSAPSRSSPATASPRSG